MDEKSHEIYKEYDYSESQFPNPSDTLGWAQALTCQRQSIKESIIPILLGPLIAMVVFVVLGLLFIVTLCIVILFGTLWLPISIFIGIPYLAITGLRYLAGNIKGDDIEEVIPCGVILFWPFIALFGQTLFCLPFFVLGFLYLFSWIIGPIAMGIRLYLEKSGRYHMDNAFNVFLIKICRLSILYSRKDHWNSVVKKFSKESRDDPEAIPELLLLLRASAIPIKDDKIEEWFLNISYERLSNHSFIDAIINAIPSKYEAKWVKQLYIGLCGRLLVTVEKKYHDLGRFVMLLRMLTNAAEVKVTYTKKWLKRVLKNAIYIQLITYWIECCRKICIR